MTSFIQIESVWRQHSEGEYPIAFSFLSPLFAVPVNLLYPHHFQIFHSVVWLAEVGRNWLFRLPRPDVGAVSIHPCVQCILCLSSTCCRRHFFHVISRPDFRLACVVAFDVILSSCNLASKCAACLLFLGSIYTVCCCICCCRCRLGGLVWSGSSGQGGPSNSSAV